MSQVVSHRGPSLLTLALGPGIVHSMDLKRSDVQKKGYNFITSVSIRLLPALGDDILSPLYSYLNNNNCRNDKTFKIFCVNRKPPGPVFVCLPERNVSSALLRRGNYFRSRMFVTHNTVRLYLFVRSCVYANGAHAHNHNFDGATDERREGCTQTNIFHTNYSCFDVYSGPIGYVRCLRFANCDIFTTEGRMSLRNDFQTHRSVFDYKHTPFLQQ